LFDRVRVGAATAMVALVAVGSATVASAQTPSASGSEPTVSFQPQADGQPSATSGQTLWNLHDIGLPLSTDRAAPDGAGMRIAVVDTGIDAGDARVTGHVGASASFTGSSTQDRHHGTSVASVIVAAAPGAQLLDVQVCDASQCTNDWVAHGITWAVEQKANVINISLAGTSPSAVVHTAIDWAVAQGVVVVAAAGNAHEAGNPTEYPAAYSSVLSVGAVGPDHRPSAFSSDGPWLDVMAPGENIAGLENGTSFAAPHVAAIAALVKQRHPDFDPSAVQAAIESSGTALLPATEALNAVPLVSAQAAFAAGASGLLLQDTAQGLVISWPTMAKATVTIKVDGVTVRPSSREISVAQGRSRYVLVGRVTPGRQVGVQVTAQPARGLQWTSAPQLFTLARTALG
jgi:subtilisin family serine protease